MSTCRCYAYEFVIAVVWAKLCNYVCLNACYVKGTFTQKVRVFGLLHRQSGLTQTRNRRGGRPTRQSARTTSHKKSRFAERGTSLLTKFYISCNKSTYRCCAYEFAIPVEWAKLCNYVCSWMPDMKKWEYHAAFIYQVTLKWHWTGEPGDLQHSQLEWPVLINRTLPRAVPRS